VDSGVIDALVGVGVGSVLGFGVSQLEGLLRRHRRGRNAARLIWWELGATRSLAQMFLKLGPGWSPTSPRTIQWESHGADLVNVVDEPTVDALVIAYSEVDALTTVIGDFARGDTSGQARMPDAIAHIEDAMRRVAPYCKWKLSGDQAAQTEQVLPE
jgi:hypothetical protein